MLDVKRVELVANAFEDHSPLQPLLIAGAAVLCELALLLLGLLRPSNALLPERRLEALQLGPGHFGLLSVLELGDVATKPSPLEIF